MIASPIKVGYIDKGSMTEYWHWPHNYSTALLVCSNSGCGKETPRIGVDSYVPPVNKKLRGRKAGSVIHMHTRVHSYEWCLRF